MPRRGRYERGNEGGSEEKRRRQRDTYGNGFSWIGRQQRKHIKLITAWHMNTTRRASAYESTAAFRSDGSNVGIMVVECLSNSVARSDVPCQRKRPSAPRR